MQLVDLSKPGEKKKLIVAGGLGLLAIIVLWWTLIGFDSGTPTASKPKPSPTPQRAQQPVKPAAAETPGPDVASLAYFTEIVFQHSSYDAPAAKRNIFAYWEPLVVQKEVPTPAPPPPTPTPPVLLASVSPSNVYARTADFKLELAGDKFSRDLRVFVDGRELPTTYINPQQLATTIPANIIASPGSRNVEVRSPDNKTFSNSLPINVADPPKPNYTYIGIIGTTNRVGDIALVQDRNNKNIVGVYRGDVIGGRFRVTSISEKELVVTDTTLKIKHIMAMSEGDRGAVVLWRVQHRELMLKMTNHKTTADHNICWSRSNARRAAGDAVSVARRRSEGGYTLVALLAMMTVLAMFAMAVAPSVQQQALREREQRSNLSR